MAQPTSSNPKPRGPATVLKPCAVKIGEEFFGGQKSGVSDIETKFTTQRTATLDQYLGLFIDFPLATSNEDEGFGQCHKVDYCLRTPVPCEFRRLVVKFPREVEVTFRAATEEEISKLPKGKAAMSWVEVVLKKGAKVSIEGFGLPYANTSHPAHEWLQHPDSAPVIGDMTLLDILQQEQFTFIVSQPHPALRSKMDVTTMPAEFDYGYGDIYTWDEKRYLQQLAIKGGQFDAAWSYASDASHVASITQSVVQDIMWLHRDVLEMDKIQRSA